MNNLIELHYCLKVEFKITREARTITMSQRKYIEKIFNCFNMKNANHLEPMPNLKLQVVKTFG